ncbi:MAG TPA: hypothetical protein VGU20_14040 [Stellaceae bacterium]|nr:hypothetical protein [Stellaceae bacterium]
MSATNIDPTTRLALSAEEADMLLLGRTIDPKERTVLVRKGELPPTVRIAGQKYVLKRDLDAWQDALQQKRARTKANYIERARRGAKARFAKHGPAAAPATP